jgi:hypothetical protein
LEQVTASDMEQYSIRFLLNPTIRLTTIISMGTSVNSRLLFIFQSYRSPIKDAWKTPQRYIFFLVYTFEIFPLFLLDIPIPDLDILISDGNISISDGNISLIDHNIPTSDSNFSHFLTRNCDKKQENCRRQSEYCGRQREYSLARPQNPFDFGSMSRSRIGILSSWIAISTSETGKFH